MNVLSQITNYSCFKGSHIPDVCRYISSISICLPAYADVYCTDIFISPQHALVSFKYTNNNEDSIQILTASIPSPICDILYPIVCGERHIGAISFSSIPLALETATDIDNVIVDPKNIIIDITSSIINNTAVSAITGINTGGSINSSLEYNANKIRFIITPNQDMFTNTIDTETLGIPPQFGIISINGVKADASGNINIRIEGYELLYNRNTIRIKNSEEYPPIECSVTDLSDFVKSSAKAGAIYPYPLDNIVSGDNETVCPPVWEKDE